MLPGKALFGAAEAERAKVSLSTGSWQADYPIFRIAGLL